MFIGLLLVLVSLNLRELSKQVADLRDMAQDTQGTLEYVHDLIDPAPSDVAPEYVDSVEIADSHVQNDELGDRVARLKEEIAQTTIALKNTPKHTPYITPLHPDVYNLPHDSIPDTSHTIEYVK